MSAFSNLDSPHCCKAATHRRERVGHPRTAPNESIRPVRENYLNLPTTGATVDDPDPLHIRPRNHLAPSYEIPNRPCSRYDSLSGDGRTSPPDVMHNHPNDNC